MKLLALHPERSKIRTRGRDGLVSPGSPLQKFWERLPDREKRHFPRRLLADSRPVRGDGGRIREKSHCPSR